MISFDRVTKRYGERLALQDVTWRMDEGECVVILGHSAAGKTTLLHLITHETLPTSGTVTVGHFSGGALTRGDRALLRRTLGVVDEDFRLLGDRSVFENVALAVRIAGRFDDAEVAPRVQAVLSEVGLRDRADRLPHELSYGERQRCAIARAVVNRPTLILADEPTGALEPKSAAEVLSLLTQGRSNKAIAHTLSCSERTVELHVSNLLVKAAVQSRSELLVKLWKVLHANLKQKTKFVVLYY